MSELTDDQRQSLIDQIDSMTNKVNRMSEFMTRANVREPSKAGLIAAGNIGRGESFTDTDGEFITAVVKANSHNFEEQIEGKATLQGYSHYVTSADVSSKSTLGTTDATGGWIIPNQIVDDLNKPIAFNNVYRNLMTVRTGITTAAVDLPFRSAAPTRATVISFGSTKTNLDLAYNGYTATMYTLAQIYDLSQQFVRQSAGAAQQDVLSELASGMAKGEAYYIRQGAGSTEPYGYVTAATNGPSTFRTTFSPSSTTLAGSVVVSIGTAASDLMSRGRRPEAAVISPDVFKLLVTQGTDTAGLFLNGAVGSPTLPNLRAGTLVTSYGIPIVVDIDAASDDMFVGEWSAFHVYIGQDFRIDTSNQAGTRWDTNLVGFRGEEELGFDARPFVYAGALQMITDVIP